jgi:Mce-associated membrane protein
VTRSRLGGATAAVAALALAILAGVQAHLAAATADAHTNALAAAKTRMPDLLSYENSNLDADLERALDQTTGSFTNDYRRILTEVVKPTAQRRSISTTASVNAAGIVSGDREEVVVLLFLTQTTTAKGDRTSVSGSRVEVTLKRSGDSWKIAGLQPV